MSRPLEQAPSTNVYFDSTFQCAAARILAGEYYVTRDDMVIVTVLGSCVAACLRDPETGIGGMNHFLLPDTAGSLNNDGESARYGSYAMELLIDQLEKLKGVRHRLEAKVFGGANVISGMTQLNIGHRNADFVLDFLKMEHIPVIASDLKNTCPRKIAYFPRTGIVRMKRLVDIGSQKIVQRGQQCNVELLQPPNSGEVELFK